MLPRHRFELMLLILVGVLIFLTYSPADSRYFWMYWVLARNYSLK